MQTTYDQDIIRWSAEQSQLLRRLAAGELRTDDLSLLDIEHIAEEVEDVGKSEQRELAHRMAILLLHLLKWEFQPERRGASWESTIRTQRNAIKTRLKKTPSLKSSIDDPDWWVDSWADAVTDFSKETGLDIEMPDLCPWEFELIMDANWKPSSKTAPSRH